MLGYERIGHLVAVSAINLANSNSDLDVKNPELSISFSNYVKSQVHLNVSNDLYGRPLNEYAEALRYLWYGDSVYYESALKVLRYFYSDMADFLSNNLSNVLLDVDIDSGLFQDVPVKEYDFNQIRDSLQSVIVSPSVETISSFEFPEILDHVKSSDDVLGKLDSYTMSAILRNEANSTELHRVLVRRK